MKRVQILLYLVLSYLSYISYADQGLIYVFAYSWKPGYCYTTNPEYPGCLEPKEYWKYNLTIHGLWPQYNTSGYPSYCSNEPFDENIPYEIGWDKIMMNLVLIMIVFGIMNGQNMEHVQDYHNMIFFYKQ